VRVRRLTTFSTFEGLTDTILTRTHAALSKAGVDVDSKQALFKILMHIVLVREGEVPALLPGLVSFTLYS
jgi:hypothetical protein